MGTKAQSRGADSEPTARSGEEQVALDSFDNAGRVNGGWQWFHNRAEVVRWASHLIVWIFLLVPTLVEMARGWRPLDDDAIITSQTFRVLSLHPPLLGQVSTVSSGAAHTLFDPGPLQYVLLTIPTHLDKGQGSLLGAALVCGVAVSVAIEAVWRSGRWLGCALIAFCVADVAWLIPRIFGNLVWNPYIALMFTLASIAIAWVVSLGQFRWWPVLVFMASVATQTQVFFAVITIALVVVSPLLGAVRSKWPARSGWLFYGVGVGVVCWLVPLVQQFGGQFGNMSAFVDAEGTEKGIGITEGLRSLAYTWLPGPVWLRTSTYQTFGQLGGESILAGVVVLAVLLAVAIVAWRTRRMDLAALASVALVASVGALITISGIPVAHIASLTYLIPELWILGVLIWTVAGWAVVELARALIRHTEPGGLSVRADHRTVGAVGAALAFGAMVVVVVLALSEIPSTSSGEVAQVTQVAKGAHAIEHGVPRGPVVLRFEAVPEHISYFLAGSDIFQIGAGIAWQLTSDGWEPKPPSSFPQVASPSAAPRPSDPVATVVMRGDQVVSVRIHK